ncbi:MAG: hypothetical protein KGQ77_08410, partial [Betaproteobacteria bacterium]|nr:hypothetical protein [Betaproteobacteria bacterium]
MSMFTWFKRRKDTDIAPVTRPPRVAEAPPDDAELPADSLQGLQVTHVGPPPAAPALGPAATPPGGAAVRLDGSAEADRHDERFGRADAAPAHPAAQQVAPTLPEPIAQLEPLQLLQLDDEAVNPDTRPPPDELAEHLRQAGDASGFFAKLKTGLRRTGNALATVFSATRIDDDLYEELEAALLMADTGVAA